MPSAVSHLSRTHLFIIFTLELLAQSGKLLRLAKHIVEFTLRGPLCTYICEPRVDIIRFFLSFVRRVEMLPDVPLRLGS